jgi:hypothetical protein
MGESIVWLVVRVVVTAGVSTGVLAFAVMRRRADGTRRRGILIAGVSGVVGSALSGLLLGTDARSDGRVELIGLCLLAMLAGLVLVALGVRGRRVGDHPHCRACGFDLFGRPESSTLCSECGTDLNARRSVVVGVRRRTLWLVFVGLFLLSSGLGVALPVARQVPWRGWYEDLRLRLYAFVPIEQVVDDFLAASGHSIADRVTYRRIELAMRDRSSRPNVFRLLFDRVVANPHARGRGFNATALLQISIEPGSTDLSLLRDDEVRQLLRAGFRIYSDLPVEIAHGHPFYLQLLHSLGSSPRVRVTPTTRITVAGQMADAIAPVGDELHAHLIDPGTVWPLVPLGVQAAVIESDVTVELDCGGGRVVVETFRHTRTHYIEVAEAKNVFPPMVPPTADDLNVEWSAALNPSWPDRRRRVDFYATGALSRRLTGRISLKTEDALMPIAFVEFADPWESMTVYMPSELVPQGTFELVFEPAPSLPTPGSKINLDPVLDLPFSVRVDPHEP